MMTPTRFRECLVILRWPTNVLAEIVGLQQKQVLTWFVGDKPVPPSVAEWLEQLVAFVTELPVPKIDPEQ
ncbi:hypothetical protein ABIE28_002024 [Devosia sp. 2618]